MKPSLIPPSPIGQCADSGVQSTAAVKHVVSKRLEEFHVQELMYLDFDCTNESGEGEQIQTSPNATSSSRRECDAAPRDEGDLGELRPVPFHMLVAAHESRATRADQKEDNDEAAERRAALSLKGLSGRDRNVVRSRRRAAMDVLRRQALRVLQRELMLRVAADNEKSSRDDRPRDLADEAGPVDDRDTSRLENAEPCGSHEQKATSEVFSIRGYKFKSRRKRVNP